MSEYRLEYSFEETVKKMTEEVQRKVDQEILDANAHVLEEFGYVKVMRCRDCKFRCLDECTRIDEGFKDYWFAIELDGFCKWAERKEGGDD